MCKNGVININSIRFSLWDLHERKLLVAYSHCVHISKQFGPQKDESVGGIVSVFVVIVILGFYFGVEQKNIPPLVSLKLSEGPLIWTLINTLKVCKHLTQNKAFSLG